MKKLVASLIIALFSTSIAMADHHGRGKEPMDGFPGIYDAGRVMLTFTGDGHIILVHTDSNVAVSVHGYNYSKDESGERLVIQDVSPPAFYGEELATCTHDNAGTYRIERTEASFKIIAVDEPCTRRGELWAMLTLAPYERQGPETDGASQ